jgi:hypothetical protein
MNRRVVKVKRNGRNIGYEVGHERHVHGGGEGIDKGIEGEGTQRRAEPSSIHKIKAGIRRNTTITRDLSRNSFARRREPIRNSARGSARPSMYGCSGVGKRVGLASCFRGTQIAYVKNLKVWIGNHALNGERDSIHLLSVRISYGCSKPC